MTGAILTRGEFCSTLALAVHWAAPQAPVDSVMDHDAAMRELVTSLAKELREWQSHTADGSCCDVGRLLARAAVVSKT